MSDSPIDTATIRRIAVAASADPRSVARRLRGQPVRGMAGHRIDQAIRAILRDPELERLVGAARGRE